MPPLRFRPRLLPAIGTACLLALFIHLGLWQAGKGERAQAARAQHAARAQLGPVSVGTALLDAEHTQDAPITATGIYEPQGSFFVDNRQEGGLPGLHLVTPLKIDGTSTRILVNRGWVGWGNNRKQLPHVDTPTGKVTVAGVATVPSTKAFFLMPAPTTLTRPLLPLIGVSVPASTPRPKSWTMATKTCSKRWGHSGVWMVLCNPHWLASFCSVNR